MINTREFSAVSAVVQGSTFSAQTSAHGECWCVSLKYRDSTYGMWIATFRTKFFNSQELTLKYVPAATPERRRIHSWRIWLKTRRMSAFLRAMPIQVGEYRSVRFLAFKVLLNVSETTICTRQLIRFRETISFILRSRGGYPLNGLVFIHRTCCNTSDTTEKRKFLLCGIASPYTENSFHISIRQSLHAAARINNGFVF